MIDSKSLDPLPYASVYLNNTTRGVYAGIDGEFVLDNLAYGVYELIVSNSGYQLFQAKIIVKDSIAIIQIVRLSSQVLKEVTVTSSRDDLWKAQLKRFQVLFFGVSKYSSGCTISNPWVLDFTEDDQTGTFTAKSSEPLNIENLSLGYRLVYQLKRFDVSFAGHTISGVIWFQEIPTSDSELKKIWTERRRNAYEGSPRHLFKSILDHRAAESGFDLYEDRSGLPDVVRQSSFLSNVNVSLFTFSADNHVFTGELFKNESVLRLPRRLEVHYLRKTAIPKVYQNVPVPISWIEVTGGSLHVNKQGIPTNPSAVTISGAMDDFRVAEALPYDYHPPAETASLTTFAKKLPVLAPLIEKPYLQTNKSYYYSGEIAWFKAYMNYYLPAKKDSLSKMLYVDLVGPGEKILTTWIYQIDNAGTAQGDLSLSDLPKGDYQLRAYTRWMLNFDKSFVFTKAIKILDFLEVATGAEPQKIVEKNLKISSTKDTYRPGEQIVFTLQATDDYGFPLPSNLSVSVSDVSQTILARNEKAIIDEFSIDEKFIPDSLLAPTARTIQYGIELKGQFVTKKKSKLAMLTFVQENANDVFKVMTAVDGSFFIQDLQLFDSTKLSVEAIGVRGKKPGKVILDSVRYFPPVNPATPLDIRVVKSVKAYHPDDVARYSAARILDVVDVLDTGIKPAMTPSAHLLSDLTIDGAVLRASDNGDLLSMIQSRVPGLRVAVYVDKATGWIRKYFKIGGAISTSGDPINIEAMVLIDGAIIYPTETQSAAEQVASMSATQIDRIEVLKFSSASAYGARGANGVIAIFTTMAKPASEEKKELYNKNLLQPIKIPGLASRRKFQINNSTNPEDNQKPDERPTVYWNPQVTASKSEAAVISFSAPNNQTQYRIVVEGVASNGKPVRGVKVITVEK